MNTKIVNQLIFLNNEYEKVFESFAEKTDLSKLFEFECENYVQKLTDTVVPLIYTQLQNNSHDKLDFYLPYIKTKYHTTVVEELKSNNRIRKHTIAAIAEDIGYNNSESFTNAFKKITGTLPSYYIKALNEKI